MKTLTEKEVEFLIECLPEDIEVEGNALASGDKEQDRKAEQEIYRQLEFNPWAWCTVRVIAKWDEFEGDDYLGCCSYDSEEDFKEGGYYEDMKTSALENLNDHIENLRKKLCSY